MGKCLEYFKSKNIPASPKTLVKHLNTNIAYLSEATLYFFHQVFFIIRSLLSI
uniref:GIY-YIG endonuclease n=1 Tax=Monilinia laxa TaxID=61186 RepID=A0A7L8EXW7_MONLA|nr:GIY-YIG endonuclease [Monilinia laxa]QOE17401.1 GIY-YIG endonuclease [Monilinia laxa]